MYRYQILLVHPDSKVRASLRDAIEAGGSTRVTEVDNGAAAVELLDKTNFDALVCEIQLSALDGWRLARLVRSGVFESDSDTPIVVLSQSHSRHLAEVTAKEYEVNCFLPFADRGQLPGVLDSLLQAADPAPPKTRLLVIEDNPDTVRIVTRILRQRFDIEAAGDGRSGLAAWRARHHHLVLLDVMLPNLSGPEVLQAILADKPTQSVVIMTADGTPERAGKLMLKGAADFIAKPFRAEQLRRVCDIAARREDYLKSNSEFSRQVAALNRETERLRVTLESIGDGVITTGRDCHVEYLNPVAQRLTGWSNRDALRKPLRDIFHVVDEYTHAPVEDTVERCFEEGSTIELKSHCLLLNRNGEEISIAETTSPIKNRDGEIIGAILVFHDVTETRQLNRRLSYQATHDSLTDLINRSEFERILSRLLEDSRGNGSSHVLCYLDLDQFKVINDTCGHMAGDNLLQQLAAILKSHVRQRDILARLGGDEFGIILEYCSLEKAFDIVQGVHQAIHDFRFVWEEKAFHLGMSIGMVPINAENRGLENTLSIADAACYLAKEKGRNRIHVYHPDDGDIIQHTGEMQWVSKVTRALEENRFRLYFQPIQPMLGGRGEKRHFELLIRMLDGDDQPVSPAHFLPAVERYDLATALDRWVIDTALDWLCSDRGRLEQVDLCCINLSGKSVGDEKFLGSIKSSFERTGIDPRIVCFEITETAAISNLGKATRFMHEMKRYGCRFALDDFGSGMSSFAYLKTLPVDYLKIDGVFVKDILSDPIDRAMVRSINEIGHIMGLQTIAEFVENDAIRQVLHDIGVDYVQGYGIAAPASLEVYPGA